MGGVDAAHQRVAEATAQPGEVESLHCKHIPFDAYDPVSQEVAHVPLRRRLNPGTLLIGHERRSESDVEMEIEKEKRFFRIERRDSARSAGRWSRGMISPSNAVALAGEEQAGSSIRIRTAHGEELIYHQVGFISSRVTDLYAAPCGRDTISWYTVGSIAMSTIVSMRCDGRWRSRGKKNVPGCRFRERSAADRVETARAACAVGDE